jgi:hypothetical protein
LNPRSSDGGWYGAEHDRFLADSEEGKPTDEPDQDDKNATASQVTVACLPVVAGGFPYENAGVEYSATRFLGDRIIYLSSLAGEGRLLENPSAPIKFAVLSKTHNRWQLGRFIDRIMSAGSVRVAAIMDLDILDQAGDGLRSMEREVQDVLVTLNTRPSQGSLPDRLADLTTRTADLGTTCDGGITYRIERSRYYVHQFKTLISDFRHRNVEGFQQYPVFVRRKLYSSYDFIDRLGIRLDHHKRDLEALSRQLQIRQHLALTEEISNIQRVGEALLVAPLSYYSAKIIHGLEIDIHATMSFLPTDNPFRISLSFWVTVWVFLWASRLYKSFRERGVLVKHLLGLWAWRLSKFVHDGGRFVKWKERR